jgi:galactokinase
MISAIEKKFGELFTGKPVLVRSPGRVNIIGEHTDYNGGFVLPAAIDKSIYVAISKREDNKVKLHAVQFNEQVEQTLADIHPTGNWATYILGVTDQLIKRGYSFSGFNLVADGDVPTGAGLSSSAALECAVVFAINELFELNISRIEMVHIAQQAEHRFAGVMCGIMDMFASMFGKKDHVIKLDCRSLDFEYRPLLLNDCKLVLFNTNVKHNLASSAYNTRRQQCEQGVQLIQQHYPSIKSLRDVTGKMLEEYVWPYDTRVYKRCRFVVDEIERVQSGCDSLAAGNLAALGKKMFETHDGLSKEYEVSCRELDFLVNEIRNDAAVLGARMMGGGFGGCTINIIKDEAIDRITEQLTNAYRKELQLELTAYTVQTGNGTERVGN